MKYLITIGVLIILLSLPIVDASAEGVGSVVGVEAGYGYLFSSQGLNPQLPHALLTGLSYGYLILDRPSTSALLSIVLGYNWFPTAAGGNALHAIVYGVEYEHVFFRQSRVALAVDYGLLFDLILEDGRQNYAFGNHTRLGLGPVFNMSDRDQLLLNIAYNMMDFPYFELASGRLSYGSLSVRYQRRL
jgi:hypothetical protein